MSSEPTKGANNCTSGTTSARRTTRTWKSPFSKGGIRLWPIVSSSKTMSDIEQVLREKKSFTLRYMLDGIKDASGEGGHMEQVRVERLDHLGLLASVIKDLGLIAMIDKRLVPHEQEVITPGEAVAGMILNGLGFANRPLSLE